MGFQSTSQPAWTGEEGDDAERDNAPGDLIFPEAPASSPETYFGQMRAILEITGPEGCSNNPAIPDSFTTVWPSSGRCGPTEAVLPVRNVADHLLEIYWNEIHVFHPFVHKPSFEAHYKTLWQRQGCLLDHTFHSVLNTIFALSCQVDLTLLPDVRESSSATFFERARRLLRFDLFNQVTVGDIQALLLMGQYLQNTKSPRRCWVVIGCAIRAAQGLRTHQSDINTSTQCDREMFRRIWHGCLMMDRSVLSQINATSVLLIEDRIMSATLGLPAMAWSLDSQGVPLPSSIDDEYISLESGIGNTQPSDVPARVDFFRNALMLADILIDVLSTAYSSAMDQGSSQMSQWKETSPSVLMDLDLRLQAFRSALPDYLQWQEDRPLLTEGYDIVFLRQASALHLRYVDSRDLSDPRTEYLQLPLYLRPPWSFYASQVHTPATWGCITRQAGP